MKTKILSAKKFNKLSIDDLLDYKNKGIQIEIKPEVIYQNLDTFQGIRPGKTKIFDVDDEFTLQFKKTLDIFQTMIESIMLDIKKFALTASDDELRPLVIAARKLATDSLRPEKEEDVVSIEELVTTIKTAIPHLKDTVEYAFVKSEKINYVVEKMNPADCTQNGFIFWSLAKGGNLGIPTKLINDTLRLLVENESITENKLTPDQFGGLGTRRSESLNEDEETEARSMLRKLIDKISGDKSEDRPAEKKRSIKNLQGIKAFVMDEDGVEKHYNDVSEEVRKKIRAQIRELIIENLSDDEIDDFIRKGDDINDNN